MVLKAKIQKSENDECLLGPRGPGTILDRGGLVKIPPGTYPLNFSSNASPKQTYFKNISIYFFIFLYVSMMCIDFDLFSLNLA